MNSKEAAGLPISRLHLHLSFKAVLLNVLLDCGLALLSNETFE